MRARFTKIARTVLSLDQIADDLEVISPEMALALDRISDHTERYAFSPRGWLPNRGYRMGVPSQKTLNNFSNASYFLTCTRCGYSTRAASWEIPCPRCSSRMKAT